MVGYLKYTVTISVIFTIKCHSHDLVIEINTVTVKINVMIAIQL